jgi:hypothetical protein
MFVDIKKRQDAGINDYGTRKKINFKEYICPYAEDDDKDKIGKSLVTQFYCGRSNHENTVEKYRNDEIEGQVLKPSRPIEKPIHRCPLQTT